MWASGFWMSTFPHACRRPREPRCGGRPYGEAGPPSIRVVDDPTDHRASCRSHRRGGAISVTIIAVTKTTDRAHPRRLVAPPLVVATPAYAAATRAPSNVVPSRHTAYKMRLNRRASATTAMRRPRRPARRSAQARNVPLAATPPTGPRRLDQQTAQLPRPRLGDVARDGGAPPNCLRAAPARGTH